MKTKPCSHMDDKRHPGDPIGRVGVCRLRKAISEAIGGPIYGGIVGSSLCRRNARDVDVIAVVDGAMPPSIIHLEPNFSLLYFDKTWLKYGKHAAKPVGLIPSILFKSIELSRPVIGDKKSLHLPRIRVCETDRINLKIKRERYLGTDRKNYLMALVFERLLEESPDLSGYSFDNIKMARQLGLVEIPEELKRIYSKKIASGRT